MLYSIYIPSPSGELVKASSAASSGTGFAPYSNVPLGSPYTDAFRGQRAPSKTELIQQLVGTAYACCDLNAGGVAANPSRLMVHTGGGRSVRFWKTRKVGRRKALKLRAAGYDVADGDVEEVVPDPSDPDATHPLLKLLQRPTNDPNGMGSYDLRYCTQLYLESIGVAYWWLPRNKLGVPEQIWLLRSHMVREVPDYDGPNLIDYYLYGRQQIPADEVIKFSNPDPYTLYYGGYSPLLAAIEKVRISRKEDAHVAALLDNMGRPDAMLIPKGDTEGGGIGPDEARRWRAMVQAEFRRAGRGGLAVSEFPGSLEVLGWKPQDIVEIERQKAIKTDICNCFGVPDALLERNAANLASAKTADYSHAKYALNPRCVRMAEVLNEKLVKLFDPTGRTFLVYDNPMPDDEVFELEVSKLGANQGLASVNEGRAAIGLDPIDGPAGDLRYMPNTMAPIGPDGRPIQPDPPKPAPGQDKPGQDKPDPNAKALADAVRSLRDVVEAVKALATRPPEVPVAAPVTPPAPPAVAVRDVEDVTELLASYVTRKVNEEKEDGTETTAVYGESSTAPTGTAPAEPAFNEERRDDGGADNRRGEADGGAVREAETGVGSADAEPAADPAADVVPDDAAGDGDGVPAGVAADVTEQPPAPPEPPVE